MWPANGAADLASNAIATAPAAAGRSRSSRPCRSSAARDGIGSEIRRRETGGNTQLVVRGVSGQGTDRAGRGWDEPGGPDLRTDRRSLRCRLARAHAAPAVARDRQRQGRRVDRAARALPFPGSPKRTKRRSQPRPAGPGGRRRVSSSPLPSRPRFAPRPGITVAFLRHRAVARSALPA